MSVQGRDCWKKVPSPKTVPNLLGEGSSQEKKNFREETRSSGSGLRQPDPNRGRRTCGEEKGQGSGTEPKILNGLRDVRREETATGT